jgi:hypothetical protein
VSSAENAVRSGSNRKRTKERIIDAGRLVGTCSREIAEFRVMFDAHVLCYVRGKGNG